MRKKAEQFIKAIKNNDTQTVVKLLKEKIPINNPEIYPQKELPIVAACLYHRVEIIQMLIKAKSKVNVRSSTGQQIITYVCDYLHGNDTEISQIVKMLIQAGANINWQDADTDRGIHYATMFGYEKTLKVFLDAGVSPNLKGLYGRTPLHYAVCKENAEKLVEILLSAGASVKIRNDGEEIALAEAFYCKKTNIKVIKRLIDEQKNIKLQIKSGIGTAIHCAASSGLTEIIKYLLKKGIDINILNSRKQTALDVAIEAHKKHAVKYLWKNGGKNKNLFFTNIYLFAVANNENKFLKTLLDTKFDKNETYDTLIYACYLGNFEAIKILLEKGVPLKSKTNCNNPLIHLINYEHYNIAKFFIIQTNIDINSVDCEGNTALITASKKNNLGFVEFLLEKGADINHQNDLGWNALMMATVNNNYKIAEFLLKKGIATDCIDKEWGETLLDKAKFKSEKWLALFKKYKVSELKIYIPNENEPYRSIVECEFCRYLPQKKEIYNDEKPPVLNRFDTVIYEIDNYDRYATQTDIILKCPICGTYYYYRHTIDTEDAFVGGPDISQYLIRLNMELAKEILIYFERNQKVQKLMQTKKLQIPIFEEAIKNNKKIPPKILEYVIENMINTYILAHQPEKIENFLLTNKNNTIKKISNKLLKAIKSADIYKGGFSEIWRKYTVTQKISNLVKKI